MLHDCTNTNTAFPQLVFKLIVKHARQSKSIILENKIINNRSSSVEVMTHFTVVAYTRVSVTEHIDIGMGGFV